MKSVNRSLRSTHRSFLIAAFVLFALLVATAQNKNTGSTPTKPLLKRTTIRQEERRLGYGSTLTIVGPPQGAIRIEGWPQSSLAVLADLELEAESDSDLDRLALVNGFVFDEDINHIRLLTTGTHDKVFMRRAAKDFPKRLLGLPWRLDYRIRVPTMTDLELDAGKGPITLSGVEGAIRINAAETEAELSLRGGTVSVVVGSGTIKFAIPVSSWRGNGADIRVASGQIYVELAPGFSGDIEATILRSGSISDSFGGFESLERGGTSQHMKARAGAGGAQFQFTVGDGSIEFKKRSDSN